MHVSTNQIIQNDGREEDVNPAFESLQGGEKMRRSNEGGQDLIGKQDPQTADEGIYGYNLYRSLFQTVVVSSHDPLPKRLDSAGTSLRSRRLRSSGLASVSSYTVCRSDLLESDGFPHTGAVVRLCGRNTLLSTTTRRSFPHRPRPFRFSFSCQAVTFSRVNTQTGIKYKEEERIIDFIKGIAEFITLSNGVKLSASQFLQHFMFPPEMQYKPISKLSGGEKRRLYLMTVLIKNPNFLILDEPTNDLDLLTLNKLEEFLYAFGGCLVLVSHDRYFMDKLVDHLFIFDGSGNIKDYNSTYTEYRLSLSRTTEIEKQTSAPVKAEKPSNKEKNELRKLEREIEEMESKKTTSTPLGISL